MTVGQAILLAILLSVIAVLVVAWPLAWALGVFGIVVTYWQSLGLLAVAVAVVNLLKWLCS